MATDDDDRNEFERLVRLYAVDDGRLHDARPILKMNDHDFSGTLRLEGVLDQYATFAWNSKLEWSLTSHVDGVSDERSGVFPASKFDYQLFVAGRRIRAFPHKVPAETNAVLRFVVGVIPIAAIIVLIRVMAITFREDRQDLSAWVRDAQQVLVSFGFDDWLNLSLGTVLANPVPAALLVCVTSLVLYNRQTDGYTFEHDGVAWRTGVIMTSGVAALGGALSLAPGWLKVVIAVVALVFIYVGRVANPVGDLKRSRLIGTVFANRSVPGRDFALRHAGGERSELYNTRDAGTFLRTETDALLTDLYVRRAAANDDFDFRSRWARVGTLADVLAQFRAEETSRRRGRAVRAKRRFDRWVFEQRTLNGMLALVVVVAVPATFLLFSPTPWMPPVCVQGPESASTAFALGGNPEAYLIDETREVVFATPDETTVQFGSCPTDHER
jgi:hypothetical protein